MVCDTSSDLLIGGASVEYFLSLYRRWKDRAGPTPLQSTLLPCPEGRPDGPGELQAMTMG